MSGHRGGGAGGAGGAREGRIRVVYVLEDIAEQGGEAGRTFLQLLRGLPRARYEAAVACAPDAPFVQRVHDLGVPVLAASGGRERTLEAVRSLARELRRQRPHLVHTGCGHGLARLAARFARVPVLVCAAGVPGDEAGEPWLRALRRALEMATSPLVDRYVVGDRASVDGLARRRLVAHGRIAVIPDGIEPDVFDPGRWPEGSWRARLRVPAEARLVGGAGHLVAGAGFRDLIRAFASLDRPDLWLVIAGDGPELEELLELSRGLGIGGRVAFPGWVEMPGFLRDLDLFVLPSRRPGPAAGLLEAMAMERAVIATDVPGPAATITDGVDGRLVPAGDLAALAAAVVRLVDAGEDARRLGVQARRTVVGEYTVERMVRRTAVLYEELLGERGVSA